MQARDFGLRQEGHEIAVAMRRDAELVRLGRDRRVMRQAQRVHAVGEGLVEPIRRQVERDGDNPHKPAHKAIHHRVVFEQVGAEARNIALHRPLIGADKAPPRQQQRIVGRALALDEKSLVEVALIVVLSCEVRTA